MKGWIANTLCYPALLEALSLALDLPSVAVDDDSQTLSGVAVVHFDCLEYMRDIKLAESIVCICHPEEVAVVANDSLLKPSVCLYSDSLSILKTAIDCEHQYISPKASLNLLGPKYVYPMDILTQRELEICKLIANSKTTKEIAVVLGVSSKTIENHRGNLMRKLNLHDSQSITRYAIKNKLISL